MKGNEYGRQEEYYTCEDCSGCDIYMELNCAEESLAQVNTPYHIASFMAKIFEYDPLQEYSVFYEEAVA